VPTLTKTDDGSEPTWSLTPGRIDWVLKTDDRVERGILTIDRAIAAGPASPRSSFTNRSAVHAALRDLERAETKQLRKDVQLPLDAPTPETLCWMEIA
jgi:hypothetical protein